MKAHTPIAVVLLTVLSQVGVWASTPPSKERTLIDRHALVSRHDVVLTTFNGDRPLQVGNGEFAFGMDATGLQTFAAFNTMSHWGWHSSPLPLGQKVEDYQRQIVETHGRPVPYNLADPNRPELSAWLTGNPHRLNLGRIGLVLVKKDGSPATQGDLHNLRQHLDLWNGLVTSEFALEGEPVTVTTACHPSQDALAAKIDSPLIATGRIGVFFEGVGDDPSGFANFVGSSAQLDVLPLKQKGRADFVRNLDGEALYLGVTWSGDATLRDPVQGPPLAILKAEYGNGTQTCDLTDVANKAIRLNQISLHVSNALGGDPAPKLPKTLKVTYQAGGLPQTVEARENEDLLIDPSPTSRRRTLWPASASKSLSFVCTFSPRPLTSKLPDAETTFRACRSQWPAYWKSGGAIDLSGSRDPRWKELERRIVLSQYLMKVNEAGSLPPQESGLVNNGWYGRFHLEMVWWHATHWALWNRWPELNRSLGFYAKLLPQAQELAKAQGYLGARWPKCIGPDGREWPFPIHAYLIWQQPHPIFFAELDYRAHPTKATLEKWRPVVEATADFLASYAFYDSSTKRYVLGPPLQVVSENVNDQTTENPTFELGYWRFGLRTAQLWRQRMGLAPRSQWDAVLKGLAPLPEQNGVYVLHEGVREMWTRFNFEHPALTGVFGLLPGDGVDKATIGRTFDKVLETWNFDRTWGWDFPMLAMCAARLGKPDQAVNMLLHPAGGFQFDERGLATGGPFPYFPANGGLLYAVAMMACGWDGAPKVNAPGFPQDGSWTVRYEGLSPAP